MPYYFARKKPTKEQNTSQWHLWQAVDAIRGANKRGKATFTIRWQQDEKYRNSQLAHEWTEDFHTTPWHHRHRYESTITLVCNDEDRETGPVNARKHFKPTTQVLASLRQEQKENERTRQRPFDEELQAKLEWMSQHWRTYFTQSSSSSSSSQIWWQHEQEHQDSQLRRHQDTHWRDDQWQDHQWQDHQWSVFQLAARSCCATPTNKMTSGEIRNGESADFFTDFAYRH